MTSISNYNAPQATAIELRTTKANDVGLGLVGLLLGSIVLWQTLIGLRSWDFTVTSGDRGAALMNWVQDNFGPGPLIVIFALFGFGSSVPELAVSGA